MLLYVNNNKLLLTLLFTYFVKLNLTSKKKIRKRNKNIFHSIIKYNQGRIRRKNHKRYTEKMDISSESKTLECEKCGRIFNKKGNLTRHLRVHKTTVQNVICSVCSRSFANSTNLKIHFESFHAGFEMQTPKSALVANKGIYFFMWYCSGSMRRVGQFLWFCWLCLYPFIKVVDFRRNKSECVNEREDRLHQDILSY